MLKSFQRCRLLWRGIAKSLGRSNKKGERKCDSQYFCAHTRGYQRGLFTIRKEYNSTGLRGARFTNSKTIWSVAWIYNTFDDCFLKRASIWWTTKVKLNRSAQVDWSKTKNGVNRTQHTLNNRTQSHLHPLEHTRIPYTLYLMRALKYNRIQNNIHPPIHLHTLIGGCSCKQGCQIDHIVWLLSMMTILWPGQGKEVMSISRWNKICSTASLLILESTEHYTLLHTHRLDLLVGLIRWWCSTYTPTR